MREWGTFFFIVGLLFAVTGLWAGLTFTYEPLMAHYRGEPPAVPNARLGIGDIQFLAQLFSGLFLFGVFLMWCGRRLYKAGVRYWAQVKAQQKQRNKRQ